MNHPLHHAHGWAVTPTEAVAIQRQLAGLVVETPLRHAPQRVAGVDMSVRDDRVRAAVVVLDVPGLQVIDHATWEGPVQFPYVPGLLSFREVPAVLAALDQLTQWPDLIVADAQGRAHPRRLGLACHLGVLLDLPTVGVAKSRLTGHADDPADEQGSATPLVDRGEQVGVVLRTRAGVRPVYVSVGNRITLEEAVAWVLRLTTRYRLPEPTRLAHHLSKFGELPRSASHR
ncbi:MAG: deoxyribonuclease V [Chloroflexi bacterium]|nr:MAG: deoxyribonuclease V [Chloroflexota bacterium]